MLCPALKFVLYLYYLVTKPIDVYAGEIIGHVAIAVVLHTYYIHNLPQMYNIPIYLQFYTYFMFAFQNENIFRIRSNYFAICILNERNNNQTICEK